ncbi:PCI-domain-containing protein [Hanseniaspora valbyensis NRRL Y-1626]|uniref:PCI-domain-containing protein n=1 Tax=Hanseniaspora valbyensis NRRL Y-1626 TaxID=766949 RepID=A0A1B7THK1_9ASCO|nr:PCI-domain-containing protein [Hanseniaspora valbyensis NRRL Y-1626]
MAAVETSILKSDIMDVDNEIPLENQTSNSNLEKVQDKFVDGLFAICKDLTAASSSSDTHKILRQSNELRSELNQENLTIFIKILFPNEYTDKANILKYVNNRKSIVENEELIRNNLPIDFYFLNNEGTEILIRNDILTFTHLLIQLYLLDSNQIELLNEFNHKEIINKVFLNYSNHLDLVNAKIWFYIQLADEKLNDKTNYEIIEQLLKFLKVAVLKHDAETQVSIICGILRAYLLRGDILSASEFVSKVEFPTNFNVSTSLEARYLYYMAKIFAIQLDYETANDYIIAAIRKAPTNSEDSKGFLQIANKLKCVIDLLMGNIPELSFFKNKSIEGEVIKPYFSLTKSVKLGDLSKFTNIINKYKATFLKDDLYLLSVRLRSNVLKTGIKIICKTYSKIHLRDICLKLKLDSEQTAEYIVAKCINDNIIEATINYETGVVETFKESVIYNTKEPQDIFDQRIQFVTQLKNDCIKSLKYPERDEKSKIEEDKEDDEDDIFSMNPETLSSLLNDFYEDDEFDDEF